MLLMKETAQIHKIWHNGHIEKDYFISGHYEYQIYIDNKFIASFAYCEEAEQYCIEHDYDYETHYEEE